MARARALWRATGLTDEDFERPIVVMANSYTQFLPGRGSGPLAESRPVPAALRAYGALTTSASTGAARDVNQVER